MPIKVMLIDSDTYSLRALRRELEDEYFVLSCSRGQSALDLFKIFKPEAVVANRLTEGFEAGEFLDRLRRETGDSPIPVWITRSEGAPESLLYPRPPEVFFLHGPAHPTLLRAQLSWHFGLEMDRRARVLET